MKRFGINGFGRIGRTALRVWWQYHREELQLAVINTSGSMELADWVHLLKYDSNYGVFGQAVSYTTAQTLKELTDDNPVLGTLHLGSVDVVVTAQKDPAKIPWGRYQVETVIESTGRFTSREKASLHLQAGARNVVLSAPPKGGNLETLVIGVNELQTQPGVATRPNASTQSKLQTMIARIRQRRKLDVTPTPATATSQSSTDIISNASCTTNCVAPILKIMEQQFGVQKAMLTTIHSYTDDQNLHDNSHKDLRRARAAAQNIVPTSTGAAISATEVVPSLKGLFDGLAVRVPTPVGSLSDMVFVLKRIVTVSEVNQAFIAASQDPHWQGILAVTEDAIVSSDIIGRRESSIVDLSLTQVVAGDMVKVVSWYDNEWGYCNRLVEQVAQL